MNTNADSHGVNNTNRQSDGYKIESKGSKKTGCDAHNKLCDEAQNRTLTCGHEACLEL
jgi:hypothetical protein